MSLPAESVAAPWQGRVFGAADRDYAFERHAALDADLVHRLVVCACHPDRRRATAYLSAVTPPSGCFYWTAKRRSSRRLVIDQQLRVHRE